MYKRKFDEVLEDAEAQLEDAGPVASAAAAAEAPLPKGKRGKTGGKDEIKLVAACNWCEIA